MSFYIIGAGSIGVFVAAKLSKNAPVTLVPRDPSSAERFANGITFTMNDQGHFQVPCLPWSQIERFEKDSFVLLTTKIYQLGDALREVAKRTDGSQTLVLCQNGLGVCEEAEKFLPGVKWGRAICWLGVRLEAPATVHVAGVEAMELAGGEEAPLRRLAETLSASGIPAFWSSNVAPAEWKKALWNVSVNGLCALVQGPNGLVLEDPFLKPLMDLLMKEALAVARAQGVHLTDADCARVIEGTRTAGKNRNSTLQDLTYGRATEMPWLNGAVVRLGLKYGVPTPGHLMIANLIQHLEKTRVFADFSVDKSKG